MPNDRTDSVSRMGHDGGTSAGKPTANDLLKQALGEHREGRLAEASRLYEAALNREPGNGKALHMLGALRIQEGRLDDAIRLISAALTQQQDDEHALIDLGFACECAARAEEAAEHYKRALAFRPDAPYALLRLGTVELALGHPGNALRHLTTALQLEPNVPAALIQRAVALKSMSRYEEAIRDLDRALALDPNDAYAWNLRGSIAIMFDELVADVAANYAKARELDPTLGLAGAIAQAKANLCDWSGREREFSELYDRNDYGPMIAATLLDDPVKQLEIAKLAAERLPGPMAGPSIVSRRQERTRIRIAYLSNHYYEHATAYLISDLFERHDRSRFEVFGVSYGPEGRGVARARIAEAVDRFIDVRAMSDRDAATLLRDVDTDIAVDLMGYVGGGRPGIVALRCAPIQVNYLGFPGTMGAGFIDYLIADPFVVPLGCEDFYSEKVIRLPDCYQPNDTKRQIATTTPTRSDLGLPERGFVFCSFNASYKITPAMFDIWMRLLRQVDGSVLWLLSLHPAVANNLRSEAQRRGVSPSRLIFASRQPLDMHLARHAVADLFLDSLPCNAHTTASDALWAGLPVVTCAGRSFASRVAGSLVRAVGLGELVTEDLTAYEALALALARDPRRLAAARAKLQANRATAPLFDIARYTRHLELAYQGMWAQNLRGEAPRAFDVAPLPRTSS